MLRISQSGKASTTITITPRQGEEIRSLLEKNIDCRFSTYCQQVGIGFTNILAMFAGRKPLSFKTLHKLFSKTNIDIECRVEFIIQKNNGNLVTDAHFPSLEDELFFEGMDESQQEPLNEKESCSIGVVRSNLGKKKPYYQQEEFEGEDPFEEKLR